jgi:hypothetical protein
MRQKEPPVTDTPAMRPDELADAAVMLRRLLALVEAGELEASTPSARAVLRRLEGATIAVELAAGAGTGGDSGDGS